LWFFSFFSFQEASGATFEKLAGEYPTTRHFLHAQQNVRKLIPSLVFCSISETFERALVSGLSSEDSVAMYLAYVDCLRRTYVSIDNSMLIHVHMRNRTYEGGIYFIYSH
jgi:hypothetical protein